MKISKPEKRLIVMRRDSEERLRQILKDLSKIECEDIECDQSECPFYLDDDSYGNSCVKDMAGEILGRLDDDFVIVRSPDCKIVLNEPESVSAPLPVRQKRKYR